ncbi:hypothetical protein V8E54_008823 [Elaphomyces granulatus]
MRDQFRRSPVTRPGVLETMNTDKQSTGASIKPFTPVLNTALRTNKNAYPLTPKLAGAAGHQSPRRPTQIAPTSSNSSKKPGSVAGPLFLSANVTPRSGSRSSRREATLSPAETTTPTPNGVQHILQASRASPSPAAYRAERSPTHGGGRPVLSRTATAKSVTSDIQDGQAAISRPGSSCGSAADSPMFFRVDNARSPASSHDPEIRPRSFVKPSPSSSSSPSFVYADGTAEENSQTEDSNGPALDPKRCSTGAGRPFIVSKLHSVVPSRLKSPQQSDSESCLAVDVGTHPNPHVKDRPPSRPPPSAPSNNRSDYSRKSSPIRHYLPHRKSCSLDSSPKTTPAQAVRRAIPITPPSFLPPDVVNGLAGAVPNLSPTIGSHSPSDLADSQPPCPLALSPIRIDGTPQHGDELAINARTERKVLDLEISNSSLLAINRALERELRKQNAELRRYRRLSRSGQPSMTASLRSVSGGNLSVVSETDGGLSERSSLHSPDDLSDVSDNDSSFVGDGTQSPSDVHYRAGDEKRFCLDLAKHQELLVDSQKINQSLKRCLSWTEELIQEGRRALEYKVHVSDIEIGGRVLMSDELGESARALLSSAVQIPVEEE